MRSILPAAVVALLVPATSQAQFVYTSSATNADVQFGTQNESSWSEMFDQPVVSNTVASQTVSSAASYNGSLVSSTDDFTYSCSGSAAITTQLTGGGFRADMLNTAFSQFTGGTRQFAMPGSHASVGEDMVFGVTASGTFSLSVGGMAVVPGEGNTSYYFSLMDLSNTSGVNISQYIAAASNTFSPINTSVNLVAGDQYEMNFWELNYNYDLGPGDSSSASGFVQLGTPTTAPEPVTSSLVLLGAGALWARRKAK